MDTVIEYVDHSLSDIAALQQHDEAERGYSWEKNDHLARPSLVAMCTVDNDIGSVSVYFTGVPTLCDGVPRC